VPYLHRAWLVIYIIARAAIHFCRRVFIAEPLFKASCREYGTSVRTDIYAQRIHGRGDLIVGDDVLIDGQATITFREGDEDDERPRLIIGSHSGIGHGCRVMVARRVSIGSHCRIAAGVWLFDSTSRLTHAAAQPVTIQDNVWIGGRAIIFPGVTIGEGSVVSAGAVVTASVPPYTVVAGHPARRVAALQPPVSAMRPGAEECVA
jgi:serine acetyltransferase